MKETDEVERHLSEQQRSGKSAVAYCSERGISIGKFYSWKKRVSGRSRGFARVQTSISVQIEVGNAKLHVPLESLNAVLAELGKQ